MVSAALLVLSLRAVILLSKMFAAVVEAGTTLVGAPEVVAGVVVAFLVLLPESMAAVRAARGNQLQKSLNLALGSSLAIISLTIPAVAVVNLMLQRKLMLGLDGEDTVLLMLTAVVSLLTFGTGRTNILYGFVHLVIFVTLPVPCIYPLVRRHLFKSLLVRLLIWRWDPAVSIASPPVEFYLRERFGTIFQHSHGFPDRVHNSLGDAEMAFAHDWLIPSILPRCDSYPAPTSPLAFGSRSSENPTVSRC
jgi:hypothetical protein